MVYITDDDDDVAEGVVGLWSSYDVDAHPVPLLVASAMPNFAALFLIIHTFLHNNFSLIN